MSGDTLNGATLSGATLRNADLRGADLTGAKGLSQEQVDLARGDDKTKLPEEGIVRPESWKQGTSEQPNADTNTVDTEDSDLASQHGEAPPREVPKREDTGERQEE